MLLNSLIKNCHISFINGLLAITCKLLENMGALNQLGSRREKTTRRSQWFGNIIHYLNISGNKLNL